MQLLVASVSSQRPLWLIFYHGVTEKRTENTEIKNVSTLNNKQI